MQDSAECIRLDHKMMSLVAGSNFNDCFQGVPSINTTTTDPCEITQQFGQVYLPVVVLLLVRSCKKVNLRKQYH